MTRTIWIVLGLAAASNAVGADQVKVGVNTPKADVTVTTDEAAKVAKSVIESSLRGVGRMLGAMRGTDPGYAAGRRPELSEIDVSYDNRRGRYSVTAPGGPRVWVDASSGTYEVDLRGGAEVPGLLIEESLAAVGSMIRGLRTLRGPVAGHEGAGPGLGVGPLGLSSIELEHLERIWRAEGLSEAEVLRRRANLLRADTSLRAAMRQLDDSMEQLDWEMEELQREMEGIERRRGRCGGGR